TKNCVLKTQEYEANGGQEIFITIEEPNLDKLIGLCRLRLQNKKTKPIFDELKGAALVRELHIYGRQKTLSQSEGLDSNTQHLGFG
ncbi:MAG: tRNA uridine(34) 5-carboxymethylaminomethyl modification radical SAM/GNAT enzyme Elp3, partial [Phycisphaerae bacterium]|nr:tRNA uridine(34) 5-carboxymethylaminomethyl modification radical SAM/GNAT enzyme Elp3 [Phycisphaerae bacterium]